MTTAGQLIYVAPLLTWTGNLPIGGSAAITYTVVTHDPVSGDGHLRNVVTSTTPGSNCSAGSTDAGCTSDVVTADPTISLTSLPADFVLTGPLESVARQGGAVTMTVTTDNRAGYTVSVRALSGELVGATPSNPDTIPIGNLRVRETGAGTYQALSDVTAVLVHSQSVPSASGGDAISNDFEVTIPIIVVDTYSAKLEYVVMPR